MRFENAELKALNGQLQAESIKMKKSADDEKEAGAMWKQRYEMVRADLSSANLEIEKSEKNLRNSFNEHEIRNQLIYHSIQAARFFLMFLINKCITK